MSSEFFTAETWGETNCLRSQINTNAWRQEHNLNWVRKLTKSHVRNSLLISFLRHFGKVFSIWVYSHRTYSIVVWSVRKTPGKYFPVHTFRWINKLLVARTWKTFGNVLYKLMNSLQFKEKSLSFFNVLCLSCVSITRHRYVFHCFYKI